MTTTATVTGTGTPLYTPGRAGPGVLVRTNEVALQFDAGQATRLRMSESGFDISELTALFITHHHSDHMLGLPDVLTTRWMELYKAVAPRLAVFAPDGIAADIADHVMDAWHDEVAMRVAHAGYQNPDPLPDVRRFPATPNLGTVATFGDVTVESCLVEHSPVEPAVGYRVTTPSGVVAVSGDTRVCDGLANLCRDADIAVCEVIRPKGLVGLLSNPDKIAAYHADIGQLGAMATEVGVGHLLLTHLIPPPKNEADKQMFVDDIRATGFEGAVTVADDLDEVSIA